MMRSKVSQLISIWYSLYSSGCRWMIQQKNEIFWLVKRTAKWLSNFTVNKTEKCIWTREEKLRIFLKLSCHSFVFDEILCWMHRTGAVEINCNGVIAEFYQPNGDKVWKPEIHLYVVIEINTKWTLLSYGHIQTQI